MGSSGKIFWTLFVASLVAGAYALWAYGPAYLDHYFGVNDALNYACNAAYNEHDDNKLRELLLERTRKLGKHQEWDYGKLVEVHDVDIKADDIAIERSQIPPRIAISVQYDRKIRLPLLEQDRWLHFESSRETSLAPVHW